jgi:hypothetical protein
MVWGIKQGRTGKGIHGLPKVSCGPAMPDPYMPCGWATPQTAFPLDTPSRTGLVSRDSLKLLPGPPCPTLLRPAGRPRPKRPHARFEVARPRGRRPAAVFYPLGYPTPSRRAGLEESLSDAVNLRRIHEGEFHDQGDNVKKEYY